MRPHAHRPGRPAPLPTMAPIATQRLASTVAFASLLVAVPAAALAHSGTHERRASIDHLIEHEPENAELFLRRAELHRESGDLAAARADCARARSLEPGMTRPLYILARVDRDAGELDAALRHLDQFLARENQHVAARIERARILEALTRHGEAAAEYTRAMDLVLAAGDSPLPEHYLERARAQIAAAATDEAVRGLDDGLARLGRPVALLLEAIEIETRIGRHQAALARIEPQVRCARGQERATWLVRRGEIQRAAGQIPAALEDFDEARSALASLPPGRQETRAAMHLRTRIDHALAALPAVAASPAPRASANVFAALESVAVIPLAWLRQLAERARSMVSHPCPSH